MSFDTDNSTQHLAVPGTEFIDRGDTGRGLDVVPLKQGEEITIDGGKISLDSAELTEQSLGFRAPNPAQITAGGITLNIFNLSRQRGAPNSRTVLIANEYGVDEVIFRADYMLIDGRRNRSSQYGSTPLPVNSVVVLDSLTEEFRRQYGEAQVPVRLQFDVGMDGQIRIINEANDPVIIVSAASPTQAYGSLSSGSDAKPGSSTSLAGDIDQSITAEQPDDSFKRMLDEL